MSKVKCPHCGYIQEAWEKSLDAKMIEDFFKTKAYRKCIKCGELFNQEDNIMEEVK